MKTPLLTGAFLLFMSTSAAQLYDFPSPSSAGMGLSGAGDTTAWSIFSNPSGFTNPPSLVAGMGYHNAFGLKDLSTKSAFISLPTSLFAASASYIHYGTPHYSLQRFSGGIARKMSPGLHMGARFTYLLQSISGIKNNGTILMDAGIRFSPFPSIMAGVMALNPGQAKIRSYQTIHKIPSSLSFTLTCRASPSLNIIADLTHRSREPSLYYAFGMEAKAHRAIILRGAVSGKPIRLAIGSGFTWRQFKFDIALNHHDPLGFSSSAGIYYILPEKTKSSRF